MAVGDPELSHLRAEIDRVDSELVKLIAERIKIVDRVVTIKKETGLPALIPDRVEEVAQRVREEAERLGAPPELAELVYRRMMDWIIDYEERQLKG
ncbi:MAG TPA: chorismate mutase [Xanthobacteraceae bacterium]|jgi:isochorismate pyruvate lyase|nr:chorismate mutase [Xanthobacteraceae bacterium]